MLLLTILLAQPSIAQNVSGVLPQAEPEAIPVIDAVAADEYILGPGDILWLSAEGGLPTGFFPSGGTSAVYLTVTPDGNVIIPMAGPILISGLTLEEGVEMICAKVDSRFRGVRATAGLASIRTFLVPVSGEVVTPGVVEALGTDRLSTILLAAGGSRPGAKLSSVLIISSEGDTARVNLSRYRTTGALETNPPLAPGDRIVVQPADALVEVEGALILRGQFALERTETGWSEGSLGILEYLPGETAVQLVARAGGLTPWALRDSIFVARDDGGVLVPAPGPSSDVVMQPGDRLVCPGMPSVVSVTGYVVNPGSFPWVAGRNAEYYIALAGGWEREACHARTSVRLPSGQEDDWEDVTAVPPGSIINAPRKILVWWEDYLTIATGVASVVIAWKSIN